MMTRHARFARAIFLYPAMGYVIAFMVLPITLIATYSFFQRGQSGGIVYSLTLDNFARAFDSLYVGILGTSVALSSTVTLLALLIGFPTALAITKLHPQHQNIALVLVILPFWTNFLIRTYAWIVLLSSEGLLNQGLLGLGIISDPLALLYTPGAVVMGLLYAYLPLMVLPIYAALSRIDPSLREAAIDLGASRFTALRQVVFPLAIPGTLVGCIFVFVPSVGNFIVPELLGGGKTVMVGNLIRDQFLKARDWPFGSVLAMAMVLMLVLLFALQARITKRVLGQA
ncbi:unannotated protein [freshwater metagenome]|uniref:Unannotated protein n=1 Tax=freshwater metagenome TaxID=449393 RepID=A0A6J6DV99_9ZZZZ